MTNKINDRTDDAKQAKATRLYADAMFHAIRGLNEINNQSLRQWNQCDITDCEYHLKAAIGYLRQLKEVVV